MTFFKKILEILNENEYGVKFDGERFFRFNMGGQFEVYEQSTTSAMQVDKITFTPMSEIAQTETPFVDLNKRSDYMKQFMFAIEVEEPDFEESNKAYLSLYDFAQTYQGDKITVNDAEYTLKTFEPVRESQPIRLGNSTNWWVLVSLSINVTKLPLGKTGTDATLEVSENGTTWHLIDATNITIPMALDFEGSRSLTELKRNTHFVNGKTIEIHADVNHNETYMDNLLETKMRSEDYNTKFWVRFKRTEHEQVFECLIKEGTPEYENGIPINYKITFIEGA